MVYDDDGSPRSQLQAPPPADAHSLDLNPETAIPRTLLTCPFPVPDLDYYVPQQPERAGQAAVLEKFAPVLAWLAGTGVAHQQRQADDSTVDLLQKPRV